MNTQTNHLVSWDKFMSLTDKTGYQEVPQNLQEEAKIALGGNDDVYVPKRSGSNLAKWSAGQRKRNRARNKMQSQSRKRNR